jgi:hypothetical protein
MGENGSESHTEGEGMGRCGVAWGRGLSAGCGALEASSDAIHNMRETVWCSGLEESRGAEETHQSSLALFFC